MGPNCEDASYSIVIESAAISFKGGAGFKRAQGRGYIHLKCESELRAGFGSVTFVLSVGGKSGCILPSSGLKTHDFGAHAVSRFAEDADELDFAKLVRDEKETFVVRFELAATHLLPWIHHG